MMGGREEIWSKKKKNRFGIKTSDVAYLGKVRGFPGERKKRGKGRKRGEISFVSTSLIYFPNSATRDGRIPKSVCMENGFVAAK